MEREARGRNQDGSTEKNTCLDDSDSVLGDVA